MLADLEFINALELDLSSLPNGKEKGFVHHGSMVSFTESLSSQNKEDVLNGTLFAQLAANEKHNRYKDFENWYKFYVHVLENIGWVVQQFQFTQFKTSASSLNLDDVVLELIKQDIGGNKDFYDTVVKTINSMEKSTDGHKIFHSKSYSGKNANFQIAPCTTDKSGQVMAAFMGGAFSASRSVKNYFFVTWKNEEIKFFYANEMCILNDSVYEQVRDVIREKLGEAANDFIVDLDI